MHQQTFGIVPAEAFQCPDVPKFLCDSVVRPQLNGQVENVWGLLHQTTSLSGPILRYIFVLAALTAMTAAVLLVPKIETLLKHARDQLASMDDDDDIDSLLEQFLRAVSSGGAATTVLSRGSRARPTGAGPCAWWSGAWWRSATAAVERTKYAADIASINASCSSTSSSR